MKKKIFTMLLAMTMAAVMMTGCSLNLSGVSGGSDSGVNVEDDDDDKKDDKDNDSDKKDDNDDKDENGAQGDDNQVDENNQSADNQEGADNTDPAASDNTDGGNSSSEVEEIDYEAVYNEVINKMAYIVSNADEAEWDYDDGTIGVWEAAAYSDNPLAAVGYGFVDLNGDGTMELIIGGTSTEEYNDAPGNEIYAVYSVINDEVCMVTCGWARNVHYIMNDNRILYFASNGYASSGYGVERFTGFDMDCEELVYTGIAPNGEDIAVFSNDLGMWDEDSAYLTDMNEEEFYEAYKEKEQDTQFISLKPFELYLAAGDDAGDSDAMAE